MPLNWNMEQVTPDWHAFHERTKFRLVLRLCLFFMVLMSIVAAINIFNAHFSATPNVLVVFVCIAGIITLRVTGKYRLVARFITVISFLIISGSFYLLKVTHYLTPMWMIVNILFTFFILGKTWGISVLIAHFLVLFSYLILFHTENIVAVEGFTGNDIATFIAEYAVVGFAIGYILNLYIINSRFSREAVESSNKKLKEQNAIISRQNSEMEVMLREIHHRVKNNLQIITSLLRLQANSMDRQADEFYKEAINRVTAMAIIHERMYQSGSLSGFDMDQYARTLVSSILSNNVLDKVPKVTITVQLDQLNSNSIVPLALLINELVMNSLKHAFDAQSAPEINLELKQTDSSHFSLMYADNGYWKESSKPSFGVEIIEAMCSQLDGSFDLNKSEKGTVYSFRLTNLM